MRITNLGVVLVLAARGFAYPSSTLTPRSHTCTNAPSTIAGTTLNRRTDGIEISTPRSSANNIYWCVQGTQTYITLTMTAVLSQTQLMPILRLSLRSANSWTTGYDGLLPGGLFRAESNNMILSIRNANNHQMTWHLLSSALLGVMDYMNKKNTFGTVVFDIFDGGNQVGQGSISF